jgi:hypothetical protein
VHAWLTTRGCAGAQENLGLLQPAPVSGGAGGFAVPRVRKTAAGGGGGAGGSGAGGGGGGGGGAADADVKPALKKLRTDADGVIDLS